MTMMSADQRPDPLVNARFRVEIDGLHRTGATGVVFPDARIVRRGKRKPVVEYGRLTLRRGLTTSSDWFDWWDRARRSAAAIRKTVVVVLMDASGADVARWVFPGAHPSAYSVSPLNALGSEPVIETLEMAVGGMSVEFATRP
jgi:phage tail-like protein